MRRAHAADPTAPGSRSAPHLQRSDYATLACVLAVALAARLIPAIYLGNEVSDLSIYRYMALIVLRGQDIYEISDVFPYTPLSLFIPACALRLAEWLHQPFHLVMKTFPLFGDLGSVTIAFLWGRRRWSTGRSVLLALAFALNPVSVLITGFHGNIMPLSVFFAFWAYYLLDHPARQRTYLLSALALGIAIGLRSWPVLLLPFLVRPGQLRWRQRIAYAFVASLPSILTLAPHLVVDFNRIQREVFGYKSVPDFGWVGAWRARYFLETGSAIVPGAAAWLSSSRFYFLGAYAVLVALAWISPALLDTAGWIATAILLNYTVLGGMAAQYYTWVLPFLLGYPAYYGVFSLITAGALVTFYLGWHPGILLGPNPPPLSFSKAQAFEWNFVFLVGTWLVGAVWVMWLIVRALRWALGRQPTRAPTEPADGEPIAPPRVRGVAVGTLTLAGCVAGTLASEIPFVIHSRPPRELTAGIEWVVTGHGSEPISFDAAWGVAAHPSGDIYVADIGTRRVDRFSSTGEFLGRWQTAEDSPVKLTEPTDIAIGPAGEVYVLDAGGFIDRLEPDGRVVEVLNLAQFSSFSPRGLAIDTQRQCFYVMDTGKGRILVLSLGGQLIATWGGIISPLRFELGWDVAVDSQGNVFTTERGNSRVRKLSPDGKLLADWKVRSGIFDVAVGADDRVYVSSSDRAQIWVYDNHGALLGQVQAILRARSQPQARALAAAPPRDLVLTTEASLVRVRLVE